MRAQATVSKTRANRVPSSAESPPAARRPDRGVGATATCRRPRSAIEFPRTPARSWSEQIAEEKPLLEFLADEKDVADLAEGGYFGAKDILERRERAQKLTQEEKDILERAGATWTSLESLRRQPRKETGPGAAVE